MATATAVTLLFLRFKVMGSTLPVFTNFDNPASYEAAPAKQVGPRALVVQCDTLIRPPNLSNERRPYKRGWPNMRALLLQSGAETCSVGFVKCFLRVPQAVGLYCSCHAAQAIKGNFQKTYCKTFRTSYRPRLYTRPQFVTTGEYAI